MKPSIEIHATVVRPVPTRLPSECETVALALVAVPSPMPRASITPRWWHRFWPRSRLTIRCALCGCRREGGGLPAQRGLRSGDRVYYGPIGLPGCVTLTVQLS